MSPTDRAPVPLPAPADETPLAGVADADWRALGERLAAAGFDDAFVGEAEAVAANQFDAVRLPLVHAWLERRGDAAATLARVFLYDDAPERARLERALGAGLLAALERAGLVRAVDATRIGTRFRLTPFAGLWVLSDPPEAGERVAMGPGPTTLGLSRLLGEAPGAVLDLGCGAGSLALVAAARGATRTVGVDLNARAIAFARCNAKLNALDAEFHAGDLLAPVAGERFDLVLSQPPYVSLPEGLAPTVYLHGGARGDELALTFAAAAAQALAPGGRALLHFDSAPAPSPIHARVRRALGDAPVDVVALVAPGPSADVQAAGYATVADPALGVRYRDEVRRYRAHLEALGGGEFSRVTLVLTHVGTPGGRTTLQLPAGGIAGLDAPALERYLAGLELAGGPDEALLAAGLDLGPGGRLVHEWPPGTLSGEPARALRFPARGLVQDREVTEAGEFLFAAVAESASVAEAVERFAEACGETADAVRANVLDFAREGLGRGLLAIRLA